MRPIDLQSRKASRISPLELGLVEQPTRPRSEFTAGIRRCAIEMAEQGVLREAADLTRAAMTEDPYARGVCGSLVDGLWGLPMNFIGNPEMIRALVDSPTGSGQWREMFPQPEARRLMTWGINLGVGVGQMRRRWHEPGEEIVTLDEAEDGSWRARRPMRPVGAHDTRILRTWDPKYLRNQWWDNTWWLMTADGEIRIEPNDGEWLLYLPYGEIKPWEYGAWKALTLAYVLGRDALFDRSRHAEVLAPVRVGKVPSGTTERQRRRYLEQIRAMQRMHAFVLPPGLEYSIVESTGKINDLYSQIIEWQERAYCLIYTGNETTIKGTTGFSAGDVQERVAKAVLQALSGSLAECLRTGGLIEWAVSNYGTADAPLARFDCDPPEDKLAKAKTISEGAGALKTMSEALKGEGLRLTREAVVSYVQGFGLAVEELSAEAVASVKIDVSPTDVAKVFTADEIRASQGAPPMADPSKGSMTIPELDAAAGGAPPPPAGPAPPGVTTPAAAVQPDAAIAASEEGEPLTDEDAASLAAAMTLHGIARCEHGHPNRCPSCRIERVRKLIVGKKGQHSWGIAWKPIGGTVATTAALGFNPDQPRADDGKFGSGGGSDGGKSGEPRPAADKDQPDKSGESGERHPAHDKVAKSAAEDHAKAISDYESATKAHAEEQAATVVAEQKHAAAVKAREEAEAKRDAIAAEEPPEADDDRVEAWEADRESRHEAAKELVSKAEALEENLDSKLSSQRRHEENALTELEDSKELVKLHEEHNSILGLPTDDYVAVLHSEDARAGRLASRYEKAADDTALKIQHLSREFSRVSQEEKKAGNLDADGSSDKVRDVMARIEAAEDSLESLTKSANKAQAGSEFWGDAFSHARRTLGYDESGKRTTDEDEPENKRPRK